MVVLYFRYFKIGSNSFNFGILGYITLFWVMFGHQIFRLYAILMIDDITFIELKTAASAVFCQKKTVIIQ